MTCYTHLIWDFNGTILNDVEPGLQSANQLLAAHGLPLISSVEEYRRQFGFPIVDYYRRLGFDFDKLPYDQLAHEWVGYYLENTKETGIFADVIPTMQRVKRLGVAQLILSATETQMLKKQIEPLGILPYLDDVLGIENIHAYSKQAVGELWRKRNPYAKVLFVGDTDHDAQVAAAIGADCILLTTGHQSRETLASLHPLFVADSASQVADFLEK